MLNTKSQGHQLPGSGEEGFKGFLPYVTWRRYRSCDQNHLNKLPFPHPKVSSSETLGLIGPVVSESKTLENADRLTDDCVIGILLVHL